MAYDAFGNYVPDNIPGTGPLPAPLAATSGESRIDPALRPYLQQGLQRAQQLFLTGAQPSLFPGQMYVSPSQQTQQALSMQEQLATQPSPVLQQAQNAYLSSLGQIGQTAAGGFLQGSPFQQSAIQAAVRPLQQQYAETTLPGIASLFSRAGRYGSGAMDRALGTATEATGRAMGDIASSMANQQYQQERQLQQQAQISQAALGQAAPSFFQAGFLPAQALAQVGAAREAIASQPLQEQIQRYQYSQQLPYQQLSGFLSSIYGTPMSQSNIPPAQTNRLAQTAGGATLGYALSGGNPFAALGGGLLGYFG